MCCIYFCSEQVSSGGVLLKLTTSNQTTLQCCILNHTTCHFVTNYRSLSLISIGWLYLTELFWSLMKVFILDHYILVIKELFDEKNKYFRWTFAKGFHWLKPKLSWWWRKMEKNNGWNLIYMTKTITDFWSKDSLNLNSKLPQLQYLYIYWFPLSYSLQLFLKQKTFYHNTLCS